MNILRLFKNINYRVVEYQKRNKTSFVFGYPYWLTIDPSSICNLQCVFCPTGQRRGSRPRAMMSFKQFRKVIDKLGPYLFHIDFCNWGEPFMNKELVRMISYAAKYGPTMKVDTNLNFDLSYTDAEAIIRSGLDSINMSVDGADQESYAVYRRGGSFDKAYSNMKLLVKIKKSLGVVKPRLHWQYLVFKHNEHLIDKAMAMAAEAGVDSIGFTAPFCSPEWVPSLNEYNNYIKKEDKVEFKVQNSYCDWPWDGITVNADGSVSPCCSVEDQKDDFYNIFKRPFWMLWNGKKYRQARKYIRDRKGLYKDNVCAKCDHIGASNHAGIKPEP